jgi:hypothetical protein
LVSAERRPVLLHDCEEHIRDRLAELQRKFAAELELRRRGARDAEQGSGAEMDSKSGDGEMDVHMRLRMQVERTKIFELPLQCVMSNFKLVGPILQDIMREYEEVFEQLAVAREQALRQVVEETADADVEFRQHKARYDREIGHLRDSLGAWRKVSEDCNQDLTTLTEDKAEVETELRTETERYLKKDSLMAQVLTSNEKLDAEHESLKDVRDVYEQLEEQLQQVERRRMAAGAKGADGDLRIAALRQQIRQKSTEVDLLQRMEELARWRISQVARDGAKSKGDGAAGGSRDGGGG